jgi:hypothetical protein
MGKKRQWIYGVNTLIFFILVSFCYSQNYVPNPGFDDSGNRRLSLSPWRSINTVDFFIHTEKYAQRNRSKAKEDRNYILREPNSAPAYVGIRIWNNYREYIQVELLDTLQKNKKYYFEMYMVCSPHASSFLKSIGVSFYARRPSYTTGESIQENPAQLSFIDSKGIRETKEWTKFSGVYTAKGGEKYLTIGNFSEKFKLKRKIPVFFSFYRKSEAYYYIDDVRLYPLDIMGNVLYEAPKYDSSLYAKNIAQKQESDSLIFTKEIEEDANKFIVEFKQDSRVLTEKAYQTLAEIIQMLYKDPDKKVHIIAYYNPSETSKDAKIRAKAVEIFLQGNKIPDKKIKSTEKYSQNLVVIHRSIVVLEIYSE